MWLAGVHPATADPSEQALISLARTAVRAEVEGRPLPLPAERSPSHPVFVTIERRGKVLGCRGDLEARAGSLQEEIVLAARAASSHDPRYRPLKHSDLDDFCVTVTILRRLIPLDGPAAAAALTPDDGLVLKSGDRTGVVLPWEGKSPGVRLEWAYRKAGVSPGTACRLYRMIAERFRG